MTHTTPKLEATKRDRMGTRYSRRIRREGRLPAVVYGHGKETSHMAVCSETFLHHLEEGAHVVELQHEGGSETCLIKDVQYDHLGNEIIHVDLARVDLNEEVTVTVPVVIKGRDVSPGAKAPNAIVEQLVNDIDVRCLVSSIPGSITADISKLELNKTLLVKDLQLPQGVKAVDSGEKIVISIHETKEFVMPEPTAEGAATAEPEVLTAKKEEGTEGEGAAAAAAPAKGEKAEKK